MALAPEKILLFVGGAVVAIGATAWGTGVFDPYLSSTAKPGSVSTAPVVETAPKMAAVPTTQDKPVGDTTAAGTAPGTTAQPEAGTTAQPDQSKQPGDQALAVPDQGSASKSGPQAPRTGAGAGGAGAQTKTDTATPDGIQPPSFDLVRVEGDGSLVVAGKAKPGAMVEILAGTRVLGQGQAGPEGDFAIVIDERMKPGDYQLVLRETGTDRLVAMSAETAVVSIPESPNGQVLALVEQPGKASELITKPKPAGPDATAAAGGSQGSQQQAATGTPTTGTQTTGTQTQAGAQQPSTGGQPATGQAATGQTASGQQPVTGNGAVGAAGGTQQGGGESQSMASAGSQTQQQAPAGHALAHQGLVAVEAVEIEGRSIFVAGSGQPGARLRAYANDILLGEDTVSPGGRFLIQAERDLKVGDYIIRVDMLGPDGVKVLARAAVPFQREPGESVAAVAPDASGTTGKGARSATGTDDAAGSGKSAGSGSNTTAGSTAQEQPAAQGSAGGQAPAEPATSQSAQGSGETQSGADGSQSKSSSATLQAGGTVGAAPDTRAKAQPGSASGTTAPAANPDADTGTGAGTNAASADSGTDAGETLSPALKSVDGSVIIRRGDSLWRISRRVYGYGTRYSTIYLANQPQIADPDRIWPGQIFTVPQKSREGDSADLQQLGRQSGDQPAAPVAN